MTAFKRSFLALAITIAASLGAAAAALAEPYRIVGFGDSLMAGYELAPGEGFTDQLQETLKTKGYDVTVENAGVSGDTTSGGLSRLDWSVPDGTDLVILELGANDMLRGVSPEITRKNLDTMIARLKARNIDVLLAGMFAAPNLGADYVKSFNAIYPDLARKHGIPLYPFFLDGVTGSGDASLALADGMHPSAAGVKRMVERALPTIEKALGPEARGS